MNQQIMGYRLDPVEATIWDYLHTTGGATLGALLGTSLMEEDIVQIGVGSLLHKGLIRRHTDDCYRVVMPVLLLPRPVPADEANPARAA
jgi:hypothetical protein